MIVRQCNHRLQISCSRRQVSHVRAVNSSSRLHTWTACRPHQQPNHDMRLVRTTESSSCRRLRLYAGATDGPNSDKEKLTVCTTDGSLFELQVTPGTTTAGSLRSAVASRMGASADMVRLAYQGRELAPDNDTQVFEIQPGAAVLHAQKRTAPATGSHPSPPPADTLTVHTMEGKQFQIRVIPGSTLVKDIRTAVAAATNASPSEVRLHYAGKELDPSQDNQVMDFKKLDPNSTALCFIMHTMKRMQGGAAAKSSQTAASSRRRRRADPAKPGDSRTVVHPRSATVNNTPGNNSFLTPNRQGSPAAVHKSVTTSRTAALNDAKSVFSDIDRSANVTVTSAPVTAPGAGSGPVEAQLAKQFRNLMKHPIPGVSVAPDEEDTMKWHVQLAGPEGTPYAGGWFHVVLIFGASFPGRSPKARFRTSIWHPNVDQTTGGVCIDVGDQVYSVGCVVSALQQLLANPNPASPLNSICAHQIIEDSKQYWKTAQQYTTQYAM